MLVTELKKGTVVTNAMKAQAYAESFNVGVTHLLNSCKGIYHNFKDKKCIEIFCVITYLNCKYGVLSKMKLGPSTCEITEDRDMKPIEDCLNIVLS